MLMTDIIIAVVFCMIIAGLVSPERANEVIYWTVPKDLRPESSRHVPVLCVALTGYGVFLCDFTNRQYYRLARLILPDRMSTASAGALAAICLVIGFACCIWPAYAIRQLIPSARRVSLEALSRSDTFMKFGRSIGIGSLLMASRFLYLALFT